MKFVGKVTERLEGASHQVRVSGTLELVAGEKPQPVELIISTSSDAVLEAFKRGQSVAFDL